MGIQIYVSICLCKQCKYQLPQLYYFNTNITNVSLDVVLIIGKSINVYKQSGEFGNTDILHVTSLTNKYIKYATSTTDVTSVTMKMYLYRQTIEQCNNFNIIVAGVTLKMSKLIMQPCNNDNKCDRCTKYTCTYKYFPQAACHSVCHTQELYQDAKMMRSLPRNQQTGLSWTVQLRFSGQEGRPNFSS